MDQYQKRMNFTKLTTEIKKAIQKIVDENNNNKK